MSKSQNIDFKAASRRPFSSFIGGQDGGRVELVSVTSLVESRSQLVLVAAGLTDIAVLSGDALRRDFPIIEKYRPRKGAIREKARIKPARERLEFIARKMSEPNSSLLASVILLCPRLNGTRSVFGMASQLALDEPLALVGQQVPTGEDGPSPELFTTYWTDPYNYSDRTEERSIGIRYAAARTVTWQAVSSIVEEGLNETTACALMPDTEGLEDTSHDLEAIGFFVDTGLHGTGWGASQLRGDVDYRAYVLSERSRGQKFLRLS